MTKFQYELALRVYVLLQCFFGAKAIYFLRKIRWATLGQHLGKICCLNVALKIRMKIRFCVFLA